jgi:hypothetical protein
MLFQAKVEVIGGANVEPIQLDGVNDVNAVFIHKQKTQSFELGFAPRPAPITIGVEPGT